LKGGRTTLLFFAFFSAHFLAFSALATPEVLSDPKQMASSRPPQVVLEVGSPADRRKFRRIRAPLYCRPAGMQFLARQREPIDISLGGLRIFSDEERHVGELLKMEFFLPDAPPVTYTAEVVWIDRLPPDGPARFDLGLKFIQLEPDALKVLMQVLGPPEES
jgi:PilZ domain-containing protein